MEINGVAHIFITASDFPRARAFYGQLLPFLGLTCVADTPLTYYCVGGRTGFGVHAPPPGRPAERFEQGHVGLHHVCWRVRSYAEVEEAHAFLVGLDATIVHGPQEDQYAPGYYSILFEDPDGVRLEINHVPGQGLLSKDGPNTVGQALGYGV